MRIKLSSFVTIRYVHFGEVSDTGNLDVVRGANEVNAGESTLGNQASSMSGFGAPGHDVPFSVADSLLGLGSEQAKVIDRADPGALAL